MTSQQTYRHTEAVTSYDKKFQQAFSLQDTMR